MTYQLAQRFEIARGRSSELDKTGTGTAAVTTFDTQGILDPTNATSPLVGKLDPMKQARIAIVNPWKLLNEADDTLYNLFRGYVDTWGDFEVDQSGSWITGTVQLVDALDLFAELRMMPGVHGHTPPAGQADIYFQGGPNGYSAGTFEHVDQRIVKVLDDIGWPGTGLARDGVLRDVFSGNVAMLEQIYARADQAVTVLDDCADAELPGPANRFMTKDGVFAFRGRFARFDPENPGYGINHWYLGGTPQAEADPENVVVISRLPAFRRSAQDLINACLALPSGADDTDVPGNLVTDATSIAAYGYRSRNIPDLLTYQGHTDDLTTTNAIQETFKFADNRVGNYKDPKTRVGQIEISALDPRHPLAKPLWAFLCGVELSDLITLTTTHPGGGGFDEDFFVEGIHIVGEIAPPPEVLQPDLHARRVAAQPVRLQPVRRARPGAVVTDVRLPQHGRDHRAGGSDQIPGIGDRGRTVRGAIQNDAVIIAGTGFTAEWNDEDLTSPSANLYTIRFTVPFASPGPIVALTANNDNPAGASGQYGVSLKTRNVAYIVVETTEFDGTAFDGGFDFLAVEAAT